MKWEYKIYHHEFDGVKQADTLDWLNAMGGKGWELVSCMIDNIGDHSQMIFKRPIEINAKLRAMQIKEKEEDDAGNQRVEETAKVH